MIVIQKRSPIIITTYGTESRKKSGGGWVVSSFNGKPLLHGANPDPSSPPNIHSYRFETHTVLSVLIFLEEYATFFKLKLLNKCTLYCDNSEIVKTFNKVKINSKYIKPLYIFSKSKPSWLFNHTHVVKFLSFTYIVTKKNQKEEKIFNSKENQKILYIKFKKSVFDHQSTNAFLIRPGSIFRKIIRY